MTPVKPDRMSPPVRRESVPPSLPPPTPDDIPAPGPQAQYGPVMAWVFQPAANSVYPWFPACPTGNFQPATLPCPDLSWLNLATPKNVEKVAFYPRPPFAKRTSPSGNWIVGLGKPIRAISCETEFFFTTPKFNILPDPSGFMVRVAPCLSPLLLARPLREAASGVLSIDPVARPKKVEKLSFGPHRLACTSKAKNYFRPQTHTFPPDGSDPAGPVSLRKM